MGGKETGLGVRARARFILVRKTGNAKHFHVLFSNFWQLLCAPSLVYIRVKTTRRGARPGHPETLLVGGKWWGWAPVVPLQIVVPPHPCQGTGEEDRGRKRLSGRFLMSHVLSLASVPRSKGQVCCAMCILSRVKTRWSSCLLLQEPGGFLGSACFKISSPTDGDLVGLRPGAIPLAGCWASLVPIYERRGGLGIFQTLVPWHVMHRSKHVSSELLLAHPCPQRWGPLEPIPAGCSGVGVWPGS